MDILCSDKTGTLTLNKLTVEQGSVNPFGNFSKDDVLKYAALSAQRNSEEAIDVVSVKLLQMRGCRKSVSLLCSNVCITDTYVNLYQG